jgi:hypothetical protein
MKAIALVTVLALSSLSAIAGGSTYNPYRGVYGGWDFDDGSSATYNPYQGVHGGYNFSDGSSAQWNPYKGVYGGWDYTPGYRHYYGH